MSELLHSELGKKSEYINQYKPDLLFPIAREHKRAELGIDNSNLGFFGEDIWTHYEISWLNNKGKPCVAIGEISYPATSKNIIESKSMKLYFNSFNNTKLSGVKELEQIVVSDLSKAVESKVNFKVLNLDQNFNITTSSGICLDDIESVKNNYLSCESQLDNETVYSNLLKSNCLVTNQPDWGTVFIEYTGLKINHAGLLKYIISLRNHNEFHEQCVEKIFHDIKVKCMPNELTVYARYTRRGGLDINPFRTTKANYTLSNNRLVRQ